MTRVEFDSRVDKLESEYKQGSISDYMYAICKHLSDKGYPTVRSYSFYGSAMDCIDFSTGVSKKSLSALFEGHSEIFVFALANDIGEKYSFCRIKFMYDSEVIKFLSNF